MKESKDKQMYKRERNRWLVWLVDGDLLEKVMDALGCVEGGCGVLGGERGRGRRLWVAGGDLFYRGRWRFDGRKANP